MTGGVRSVAVVTGAARGIGLAITRRYLVEGWAVALIDIDGEPLGCTAEALEGQGDILPLVCDVAIPDQVKPAFHQQAIHLYRPGITDLSLRNFLNVGGRNLPQGKHIVPPVMHPEQGSRYRSEHF